MPVCEHCGGPGEHLHHWAPIAIFGRTDADRWPRAWLCRECHREWHRRIARQRSEDGVENHRTTTVPEPTQLFRGIEGTLDDLERIYDNDGYSDTDRLVAALDAVRTVLERLEHAAILKER
jgi:hypothetical protein